MSAVSSYKRRAAALGATYRERSMNREKHYITTKLPDNLSYKSVTVEDETGYSFEQNLAIIDTDELNVKRIYSMPDEDIVHGGLVFWCDNYWLINQRDANTDVYVRGVMTQCNYLAKWIDQDDVIHEQWAVVSTVGSGLTGEYEDRFYIATRGDTRMKLVIGRNPHTVKFDRSYRFIMDDPDSPMPLAYEITKPMAIGNVFNGRGILEYGLLESNVTADDNTELAIADYYKHFPKYVGESPSAPRVIDPMLNIDSKGREVWL